jgi:hypothetical protein
MNAKPDKACTFGEIPIRSESAKCGVAFRATNGISIHVETDATPWRSR